MTEYVVQTVALFEKYYYIKSSSREEAEKTLIDMWKKRDSGEKDLPYYLGPQLEEDIVFSIAPYSGNKPDMKLIINGKTEAINKIY